MKKTSQARLNEWWYRPLSLYKKPLLVFSAFYRLLSLLHRLGDIFRKKPHFKVPIIVVGNITVGGTGKTPLVSWLAQQLQQQGFKPGIVSRGYGGHATHYPCVVDANSLPQQVGDEPLLLFLQTKLPVVVDPKRVRAVAALLHQFDCDVVISDDGLQHRSLPRNIEILVLDGQRRFGNGYCLPVGPLREPVRRVKQVDFVVANGLAQGNEVSMQLSLSDQALSLVNQQRVLNLSQLSTKTTKNLHAVAGIGNPQRFFKQLSNKGLTFKSHVFPDHHCYQPDDFSFLAADDLVLMTEKDAVKCRLLADSRFYYLPVSVQMPMSFRQGVMMKLKKLG